MGRIEEALRLAERTRDQDRSRRGAGLREIAVEHVDGEASGFSRRFRQHSILIGRGEHNDVPFDPFADPTVSAQHAEIRIEGDEVLIYDMGSLNGVFTGAERVRRAILEDGAEIRLGRAGPKLRVRLGEPVAVPAPADPPRGDRTTRPDPALPDTAETPVLAGGVFSRGESLLLGGLLVAVLADLALGILR